LIFGFIVGVCTLPGACLSPTEVNVLVMTDLRCPQESGMGPILDKTDVLVKKDGQWENVGSTTQCVNGRVGNIVFVPGASDQVHLRVEGTVRGHARPLDADRILRFLSHQPLDLTVDLSTACVDVDCPGMQTCIKGICQDPPDTADGGTGPDGGSILDALQDTTLDNDLSDTRTDGKLDAPFDVVPLDGVGGDAGCLSFKADYHWPFDEGMSPVNEVITMVPTTIGAPFTLASGLCKGSLSAPSPQNPLSLLGTSNWKPTSLHIGFYVRVVQGSGPFLARGAAITGGWLFTYSGGSLTFKVTGAGNQIAVPMSAGTWHEVIAIYKSSTIALTVDGQGPSGNGSLMALPTIIADVLYGTSGITVSLDELYLAQ
jgi:hypothetical protein